MRYPSVSNFAVKITVLKYAMVASSETHVGRVIFLNHLTENLVPKIYKILLLLKLRIFYNEGQFFL